MDIVYSPHFHLHICLYKSVLIHDKNKARLKKISFYHLMLRMPYTCSQTLYHHHTQEECEVVALFPREVRCHKKHLNENLQHH